VLLVLVMIALISDPQYGPGNVVTFLLREVAVGSAVGILGGMVAAAIAWRARRLPTGLVMVGALAAAALAYGIAGTLHGSGFLAVYLVGLALGDSRLADREPVIAFHRGLATVAEIGMFFALGLLVFPSQFGPIALNALLLALITAVLARPVAAALATVRQGFTRGERALLAWAGLRGAVPVILATFAVIDKVPRSVELLNVVFFAVLLSAALQGISVQWLARRIWRRDGESAEPRSGRQPSKRITFARSAAPASAHPRRAE
jgi:potassium/hydrogen antiporter